MTALDPVEVHARALATARPPGARSAILAVGGHQNALWVNLYVSARRTPLWPHHCGVPGEGCRDCDPAVPNLDGAFDAMRPAAMAHFTGLGYTGYRRPYLVARDDGFERVPIPPESREAAIWHVAPDRRNVRLAIEPPLGVAGVRTQLYAHAARNPGHAIDLRGTAAFEPTDYDRAALANVQAWTLAALGADGGDDRAIHLQVFAEWARARFAKLPAARSALLCVSQYWNDNADDECHADAYLSERDVPLWPHPCVHRWDADDDDPIVPNGEWCASCGALDDFGIVWGHAIAGLAPFAIEGASQDMDRAEAYRPFAIARRVPDARGIEGGIGVEVEMIATCRRPNLVIGALPAAPAWPDDRARALADADGDGDRAVLADHLIEVGDPRGEAIAHALASGDPRGIESVARELASGDPRGAVIAHGEQRCDRATAEYRRGLVGPLGRVIALAGARFARGALVAVDVFAATPEDADAVRGDPAWRTVETLRYLPGSHAILHPVFARRLRSLLGATEADARVLAAAAWAIDTLAIAPGQGYGFLGLAAQLPGVRHVVADLDGSLAFGALGAWRDLASFTIVGDALDYLGALPGALASIPELAHTIAVAAWDELGAPAGWRVAIDRATGRAEVSLAGWIPSATRASLGAAVACAKRVAREVALVASPYFVPTDADREELGLAAATRTAP